MNANRFDAFRRARDGSPHALGELFDGCRQYLLLIANEELGTNLKAKMGGSDLVQETFLRAQERFESFKGSNKAELRAWLRTILLHHLATAQRYYVAAEKRRVSLELSLDDDGVGSIRESLTSNAKSPIGHAMDREQEHILSHALQRLSDRYQRVIQLRHRERLSFEEIAFRLVLSPEATRQLWARAIKRLRREISICRSPAMRQEPEHDRTRPRHSVRQAEVPATGADDEIRLDFSATAHA